MRERREAVIGVLTTERRRYEVLAWEGYGVVAPTLCTSNGSAALVAEVAQNYGGVWESAYPLTREGLLQGFRELLA